MNRLITTVTTSNRHFVVLCIFVFFALALLGRAVYLQFAEQDRLALWRDKIQKDTIKLEAPRGTIVDRNNEILAESIPVFAVCINPQKFTPKNDDADKAIEQLTAALELDPQKLLQRLEKKKDKQFIYVQRQVPSDYVEAIKALNIAGVFFRNESRRYYPMGEFAAHLLGVTNIDGQGIEGVEYLFDTSLRGRSGSRVVKKDRYGRVVLELEDTVPPQFGKKLSLSIDRRLQYRAHKILKTALAKHRAKSGSIVALDPRTGEVLLMVNGPSFNPNDRRIHDPSKRRNLVMTDVFEPGSTIKPLIVAMMLQNSQAQLDDEIDTSPGYYSVKGKKISDWRNYGKLSVAGVLIKSSNVGMSKLSSRFLSEELWAFLTRLGFGDISGTSFPGEASGKLAHHSQWQGSDHAVLSYGYGISVSLLQLAHAYTIIANDGWQPTLSIQKVDETLERRQVIKPQVAQVLRRVLHRVVSAEGTAASAQVEGYSTAGKSGTVKKYKGGEYAEEDYISLFVGFAPVKNPRVVVAVVVDSAKTEYYGGKVAAPVFAQVVSSILQTLDVPYDQLAPFQLPASDKNILAVTKTTHKKQ